MTPLLFHIDHSIRYIYSRSVFLEPHEVRLRPRSGGDQLLQEFDLQVEPSPAGMTHCLDAEGNNVARFWFSGEHSRLKVTARSRVQTIRENPFDYLPHPSNSTLPLRYDELTTRFIAPALERDAAAGPEDEVSAFAQRLGQESGGQLLPFLDHLNQTIYTDLEHMHRARGAAWPASETLAKRQGACRDMAVLFVDACRSVGIAARFVSGYQEGEAIRGPRELHAWPEVYIPGAGWRGYDPTHGLAVSDRHVALAASVHPTQAGPLLGTYRGTGAMAVMEARIELQTERHGQHQRDGQPQQQSSTV